MLTIIVDGKGAFPGFTVVHFYSPNFPRFYWKLLAYTSGRSRRRLEWKKKIQIHKYKKFLKITLDTKIEWAFLILAMIKNPNLFRLFVFWDENKTKN